MSYKKMVDLSKNYPLIMNSTIMADTSICDDCIEELFDSSNRRYLYPYIGCSSCGPKYTVMKNIPFRRENTTLTNWNMCASCKAEYENPASRRYHSELNCCPECGPNYYLSYKGKCYSGEKMIHKTVKLLHEGVIIAIKNNGGYHLVCDALNKESIQLLRKTLNRERKPFAMMVKDIESASMIVELSSSEKQLLLSNKRPIVLAESKGEISDIVAPNNKDLGIMLPYNALHYVLFHFGAPRYLIMTSANYPGEPTIYQDQQISEFVKRFDDACLIGERPIARSVDDSVVKQTKQGMVTIRKSRGYEPILNMKLQSKRPILTVGADLKNTITLVKDGKVMMSHHLGDLTKYDTQLTFEKTVESFLHMNNISLSETIIGHDLHPNYFTTRYAKQLDCYKHIGIQHHKAHLASLLAKKNEFSKRVIGIVFDGTGYGENDEILGGEIFVGSLREGFKRQGHLRKAALIGGDAATKMPVQALAGFVDHLKEDINMVANKLHLPKRFLTALKVKEKNIYTFPTTSVGRLFDAIAAILGFHREISFEGEAAIWLEHLAASAPLREVYSFPWTGIELDYRPLMQEIIQAKINGVASSIIARGFHRSLAQGVVEAIHSFCETFAIEHVALSGGVFQNSLLISDIADLLEDSNIQILSDREIPVNDNCISLGQAAMISVMISDDSD